MKLSLGRAAKNLVLSIAALCAGCGSSPPASNPSPLLASDVNLVFVVSEDLDHSGQGDVNPVTATLTNQGLQRSLAMGAFLRNSVLGGNNVTAIYALEPTTHLQTANHYPDLNALMSVQQFALLNQITLSSDLAGGSPYTGQNYPINVSYASGAVPDGVAVPAQFYPTCQGLDYNDTNGNNEALVNGIIGAGTPGFYVFAAPWKTVSSLLAKLNTDHNYNLSVPAGYVSPNHVYALSIAPATGTPRLATYDSRIMPSPAYPKLEPSAFVSAACSTPSPAAITITGGVGGAVVPANINKNETIYLVRHAEAHPHGYWSDNNYVGAGQWRALDLPSALLGKIAPDQVWSVDPAQSSVGTVSATGLSQWSSVAPALTVQPYAIANGLPFNLVSSIDTGLSSAPANISDYFFTGGTFSNHKLLVGWMYTQNPLIVNALLSSYFPNGGAPTAPGWSPFDYDSLWVITIDAAGNLTADFSQCEGISSSALPEMPPAF
ncbi:hypothetical protein [Geobacter sp. AOG2]|uniref:hypothetical protein n=1 Tax=Geobacter sp. AOG2 TaxID=1566347 RepID=UPI001CC40151|nr:hypothetical protein [Geobacter sp. AOG2]GFE62896.1 hypothetical protein AOG2_34850 [Geobacter sp. AOG2]